jgi:hypothetical protein
VLLTARCREKAVRLAAQWQETRQKLAIDLGWWCLFSVSCDAFRLCFASD